MNTAMRSPTDAIMNLNCGKSDESASLVLLSTGPSRIKVIAEETIPGIVAPDLLTYNVR